MARPGEGLSVEVAEGNEHGSVKRLSPGLVKRLSRTSITPRSPTTQADIDARLEQAERRRKEFRGWLSQRRAGKHQCDSARLHNEGTRSQRLAKLQDRLASASDVHARQLESRRLRAARFCNRREAAAERAAAMRGLRHEGLAERIEEQLRSAEERRQALKEAERERLKGEHKLVLQRLTMSKEDHDKGKQRLRLQERMMTAEQIREARLADRVARAGGKVDRAKQISALTKQIQKQEADIKREQLDQKLQVAAERRMAAKGGGSSSRGAVPSLEGQSPGLATNAMDVVNSLVEKLPKDSLHMADGQGSLELTLRDLGEVPTGEKGDDERDIIASSEHNDLEKAALSSEPERSAASEELPPMHAPLAYGAGELEGDAEREFHLRVERFSHTLSSRRIARSWRAFCSRRSTTATLARAFVQSGITSVILPDEAAVEKPSTAAVASPAESVPTDTAPSQTSPVVIIGDPRQRPKGGWADGFDQFATALRSSATLKSCQALMRRLEFRLKAHGAASSSCQVLLQRLCPPAPPSSPQGREQGKEKGREQGPRQGAGAKAGSKGSAGGSNSEHLHHQQNQLQRQIPRYPPRIFLCSYMILRHPEVVFDNSGEKERQLALVAAELVARFEALLEKILDTDSRSSDGQKSEISASPLADAMRLHACSSRTYQAGSSSSTSANSIASLLLALDDAWMRYLDAFAEWKGEDASALEADLVRVAVALEKSAQRKQLRSQGVVGTSCQQARARRGLEAVLDQVTHDHKLLRSRIEKLGGPMGVARLDAALSDARHAVLLEEQSSVTVSEAEPESESTDAAGQQPAPSRELPPAAGEAPGAACASEVLDGATSQAGGKKTLLVEALPPSSEPQPAPAPAAKKGLARGWLMSKPTPSATATAATPMGSTPSTPMPIPTAQKPHDRPTSPGIPSPGAASPSSIQPGMAFSPTSSILNSDGVPPPQVPPEVLSNLQMVNQLLHNPNHQISSTDATACVHRALRHLTRDGAASSATTVASIYTNKHSDSDLDADSLSSEVLEGLSLEQIIAKSHAHARAVSERAFWDVMQKRFSEALQHGNVAVTMVGLVSELGCEVASVGGNSNMAISLAREFSEPVLSASLVGVPPQAGLSVVLTVIERIARLVVELGAPARELDTLAAHAAMRQELQASIANYAAAPAQTADEDKNGRTSSQSQAGIQLASAIAACLRLLQAQIKLLKLDCANARLGALAQLLKGDAGISYLRKKFSAVYNLPLPGEASEGGANAGAVAPLAPTPNSDPASETVLPPINASPASAPQTQTLTPDATSQPLTARSTVTHVGGGPTVGDELDAVPQPGHVSTVSEEQAILRHALPRTYQWMVSVKSSMPSLEQYLQSIGILVHLKAPTGPSSTGIQGALPTLRAGLRRAPSDSSLAEELQRAQAVRPVLPVLLQSERGLLRAGLTRAVAAAQQAVGPHLPETLILEADRLHEIQNTFQSLVIVTAALLLVQQMRAAGIAAAAAAAAASEAAAAGFHAPPQPTPPLLNPGASKRRLLLLLTDPSIRLSDLVSELAVLASDGGTAGAAELEPKLNAAFLKIVDPASAGFRSISNAIAAALLSHVIIGPPAACGGGAATGPAATALARVGAAVIAPEVAELGDKLSVLCGVNEAVYLDVYSALYRGLPASSTSS